VQRHAKQDADDRPLYPPSLDSPSESKVDQNDNEMQEQPQEEPPIPAVNQPCREAVDEEPISHVESMPGWSEPVYETVCSALYYINNALF